MKLEERILGFVRVSVSKPDANTIQFNFIWPGFSFDKKLSMLEIFASNLSEDDYVTLLVDEANREYKRGLALKEKDTNYNPQEKNHG
jgi:hypothetical protein